MRKLHLKSLLAAFVLIVSCESEEFEGVNGTLTIEVAENSINDSDGRNKGFFVVHGVNGEILSSGKIVNGKNYNIEINDYNEQNVNISLIRIHDFPGFVSTNVNTFLEVAINEKIQIEGLGYDIPSTDVRTELTFENLNESIESVRLSRAGFFTPVGPGGIIELNGVPLGYGYLEKYPEIFVTTHFADNTFTYSKLGLTPNTPVTIDPNIGGINMLENQINVGNQGLTFKVGLSGIHEGVDRFNRFSMYDGLLLDNPAGELNIPVPSSNTFDMLEVSLKATIDNVVYGQNTRDATVPDSFTRLDADITVGNTDFESANFTVTGEHNFTLSSWQNTSQSLKWDIYAPDGQKSGSQLQDLPDSLVMEGFNDAVDELELSYILAGKIDNSTYSELLNKNSLVRLKSFFSFNDATRKGLTKTITYK